jgi:predicted enzyme related to lactoylglutathione lyase
VEEDDYIEQGSIVWTDLTVPNAKSVAEFYAAVVGWEMDTVDMDGYEDFEMVTPSGETAAGICHTRGINADMPPQWLLYVAVQDVAASAKRCVEKGGKVVTGPRDMGGAPMCVVQDPAGAMIALYEVADAEEDDED